MTGGAGSVSADTPGSSNRMCLVGVLLVGSVVTADLKVKLNMKVRTSG